MCLCSSPDWLCAVTGACVVKFSVGWLWFCRSRSNEPVEPGASWDNEGIVRPVGWKLSPYLPERE